MPPTLWIHFNQSWLVESPLQLNNKMPNFRDDQAVIHSRCVAFDEQWLKKLFKATLKVSI